MLTRKAVGWLSWAVTLLLCGWTELAAAQQKPEQRTLGFSNLVFRVDRGDDIGIADEDFRIHIGRSFRSCSSGSPLALRPRATTRRHSRLAESPRGPCPLRRNRCWTPRCWYR